MKTRLLLSIPPRWGLLTEQSLKSKPSLGRGSFTFGLPLAAATVLRGSVDQNPTTICWLRWTGSRTNAKEIDVLHEYVRWLSTRDVMAPKILFTYRGWGSSRMAKRWINGDAGVAGLEETSVNRREGKHVRIEESADFA